MTKQFPMTMLSWAPVLAKINATAIVYLRVEPNETLLALRLVWTSVECHKILLNSAALHTAAYLISLLLIKQ